MQNPVSNGVAMAAGHEHPVLAGGCGTEQEKSGDADMTKEEQDKENQEENSKEEENGKEGENRKEEENGKEEEKGKKEDNGQEDSNDSAVCPDSDDWTQRGAVKRTRSIESL